MEKRQGIKALPTEQGFFNKYLTAIVEDWELAKAYFNRFHVEYINKTPEEIGWQLVEKLSAYGGYEVRRKLIKCVDIHPSDCILDIGPEMGMECFLLAEIYDKVLVAEPDSVTPYLLKGIAEHYYTEDGRKASDVLDIRRMGIIPPNSSLLKISKDPEPSGIVSFDAIGAPDIGDVIGQNFADRILGNHLGWLMPAEPRLLVLIEALSSYCSPKGTITWCDDVGELSGLVVDYMKYQKQITNKETKYYKYHATVAECSLKEIKKCIVELLPDFSVDYRYLYKTGQIITMARNAI